MCSTVPKAIGAQAASRRTTPSGTGTTSRAGMFSEVAREAVDVEAHDAGDVLAEIVAALAAGLAGAAGQRAVHHDRVAGLKPVTPGPTAATSPAASAPTTSGSLRLAKAMPR
jgi:hypothetical protein